MSETAPDILLDPVTLHLAAQSGWSRVVDHLLVAGANPNSATLDRNVGTTIRDSALDDATPLKTAMLSQFKAADKMRLLLKHGADPQRPGLLGRLIDSGPDAIPLIGILLEAGADPNAVDPSKVPPIVRVFNWDLASVGDANQKSAKHWKQVELIQLLLKHGADPNTTYGEFSRNPTRSPQRSETKYQASPFVEDTGESKSYPASLLMMVVTELSNKQRMNNVTLIKILLDAGAKPNNEFPEVFDFVARSDDSLPIAKALLPFRPETLNLIPNGYFLNWNPEVKRLFLDEVLNPTLAAKGGIHFVLAEQGGSKTLVQERQPIPATAKILSSGLSSVLTIDPAGVIRKSDPLNRPVRL